MSSDSGRKCGEHANPTEKMPDRVLAVRRAVVRRAALVPPRPVDLNGSMLTMLA